MINKFILKDLEDVIKPLPTNKRERQQRDQRIAASQRMNSAQQRSAQGAA